MAYAYYRAATDITGAASSNGYSVIPGVAYAAIALDHGPIALFTRGGIDHESKNVSLFLVVLKRKIYPVVSSRRFFSYL